VEAFWPAANMVRAFAKGGPMNTIRKFILAVVATAVATSFLSTSSFAKKSHKAKEQSCSVGQVCMKWHVSHGHMQVEEEVTAQAGRMSALVKSGHFG
jgi:hypothetical protein